MARAHLFWGLTLRDFREISREDYLFRVTTVLFDLLKERTDEQICNAADTAFMLADAQVAEREGEIEAQTDDNTIGTLPYAFGGNSGLDVDLEIPYPVWLDALIDAAADTILDGDVDEELPDAKEYEYFAAYAFIKVGEALSLRQTTYLETRIRYTDPADAPHGGVFERQEISIVVGSDVHLQRLQRSHACAMEALETACYAEHLYRLDTEDLHSNGDMRKRLSLQAKLGGDARSMKYKPVIDKAWSLALAMAPSSGVWKSRRQAVFAIQDEVMVFAADWGVPLSPQQAPKTIDGWLRNMPEAPTLFAGKRAL